MTNAPDLRAEGLAIDAEQFLRFAHECSECDSEAAFCDLILRFVRRFLPHGVLAAVIGRVDLEHVEVLRFVGVDFPAAAQQHVSSALNLDERPVIRRWLQTREPQVIQLPDDAPVTSVRERYEIETFNLGRLAVHGAVDLHARTGSYLSFGRVPTSIPRSHILAVLRMITPPLHQALMSAHFAGRIESSAYATLTPTERDLLKWVAAGRTNDEIARLRGRSVATVRNQLHSAFLKLGAGSRAEAVRLSLM